ncbi:hypothetical protein QJQ45_023660 [Haematococcus lacustris]|nr:hypothetical protein QJQ45_023660 [Haematococcus lacustris]
MRTSPFQQLWKLGLQRPLHDALRAAWPASFSCGGLTASLHTIADPTATREQSRVAVFDGVVKARHRDRAAYLARLHEALAGTLPLGLAPSCSNVAVPASEGQQTGQGPKSSYRHDPLLGTVADRLLDRLEDCVKTFPKAAIIGGAVNSAPGAALSALQVLDRLAGGRAGIQSATVLDTSPDMLQLVQDLAVAQRQQVGSGAKAWPAVSTRLMDPSLEVLPVEPHSFDVVISCLGLHWINDLPHFAMLLLPSTATAAEGNLLLRQTPQLLLPLRLQLVMAQCRFALVPDGLFLSAMFGGDTLQELRIACSVAHMERAGGVTPVVSPFAQVRDGGNLLTRAGLALPAVDQDDFVVRYAAGPAEVVDHMRVMGESNAVQQRQCYLGKDVPLAAAAAYSNMFGSELDGSVQATYQVMYLAGWSPHETQRQPAKRGSATVSFQELATGLVDSGKATGGSVGAAEDSGGGEGEQEGSEPAPC